MKKSSLLALLLALAMVFSLSACSGNRAEESAGFDVGTSANNTSGTDSVDGGEFKTEGLRFVLIVKDLANPYWTSLVEGMQDYCDANGITLDVHGTENDTAYDEQVTLCETVLTENYDAILVAPLSSTTICSFIKECNDVDQPVFILDSAADAATLESLGAAPTATFEADNYSAGYIATQYMIDAIGEDANIVILNGNMASEAAVQINYGMQDTLEKYPNITVLDTQSANWNRNMGYEVTEMLLTAYPNIDGILAANDHMGLGALMAVEDAGMLDQITIVSINFMADAQAAIKEGKLYASVDKEPYVQGEMSAEVAVRYLSGESIDEHYDIPVVGYTANDF